MLLLLQPALAHQILPLACCLLRLYVWELSCSPQKETVPPLKKPEGCQRQALRAPGGPSDNVQWTGCQAGRSVEG